MNETATMHKCKHGCGYEHKKRGAVNLHERYHCPKVKGDGGSGSASSGSSAALKCDCEGGPSLAFMNKADPRFQGALASGYKKICTECLEVFK
jgi:hypothetical protein